MADEVDKIEFEVMAGDCSWWPTDREGFDAMPDSPTWPCRRIKLNGRVLDDEDERTILALLGPAANAEDFRPFRCGLAPDANLEPADGVDEWAPDEPEPSLSICEVCGSEAACGYDTEGRPWIHASPGGGR